MMFRSRNVREWNHLDSTTKYNSSSDFGSNESQPTIHWPFIGMANATSLVVSLEEMSELKTENKNNQFFEKRRNFFLKWKDYLKIESINNLTLLRLSLSCIINSWSFGRRYSWSRIIGHFTNCVCIKNECFLLDFFYCEAIK